jgi:hypothetical protein
MNPKLRRRAAGHGGTFSRQDAVECGYTVSQVRERLRDGRWILLRRGFYAERSDSTDRPPWERETEAHRLAVHAAARALAGSAVVISHQSAVVLHGLPSWGLDLDLVHVTRTDRGHGRILAGTSHHVGELPASAVTSAEGLPATTVARAIIETSCAARYEAAVVLCDSGLRSGLVTRTDLTETLGQMSGWPGTGTPLAAVAFADERSESVGETRLRVLLDTHGLPAPDLQVPFGTGPNEVLARVDFFFREYQVVVEFDGMLKYRDDAVGAVVREKHREDRLRSAGVLVVRVTWDDLDQPERVVHRIRQAFARAERAGMRRVHS